jgi:hypothetical protein
MTLKSLGKVVLSKECRAALGQKISVYGPTRIVRLIGISAHTVLAGMCHYPMSQKHHDKIVAFLKSENALPEDEYAQPE